jgi:leucyl aminopeptidase (aminopeptidase T)
LKRIVRSGPEDRLARMVLDQCLGVRRGETVTVETWNHTLPWARAFVLEARRRGGEPTLVVEDEEAFFRSLAQSGSGSVPSAPAAFAEASDAYVYFPGPEQFPRLLGLSAEELEAVVGRHGPAWWRAARRAGLRAARIAVAAATPAAAARFGVDRDAWERELVQGSLVSPDRLARSAGRLVRRLHRAHQVRIHHPNGTDLTLELFRAPPVVEDGRVDRADRRAGRLWTQIPTGVVAVPLALGVAEGVWESNRGTYDRFSDPPVTLGARLSFHRGRLSEYSFDQGGAAFARAYARGGRGRESPGALTFGVNPAISQAPEVGEVAAGTVGLLLGGNRSLGGRNPSRFAYLTTLAGASVDLDGEPFLEEGTLVRAMRASGRSSASAE